MGCSQVHPHWVIPVCFDEMHLFPVLGGCLCARTTLTPLAVGGSSGAYNIQPCSLTAHMHDDESAFGFYFWDGTATGIHVLAFIFQASPRDCFGTKGQGAPHPPPDGRTRLPAPPASPPALLQQNPPHQHRYGHLHPCSECVMLPLDSFSKKKMKENHKRRKQCTQENTYILPN